MTIEELLRDLDASKSIKTRIVNQLRFQEIETLEQLIALLNGSSTHPDWVLWRMPNLGNLAVKTLMQAIEPYFEHAGQPGINPPFPWNEMLAGRKR